MKRRLTLFVLIVLLGRMYAQWSNDMYAQYTYANYTDYAPFNQSIDATGYDAELMEAAIFYETNRQRVLNGLPQLAFDERLEVCAHNHSVDMVNHDFFSHNSPVEGKYSMGDRFAQVGYGSCWRAENIAYRSISDSYAQTAKLMVESQWMRSEGHRENILNSIYTHLGCGVAFYSKGSFVYVKATQNFMKK